MLTFALMQRAFSKPELHHTNSFSVDTTISHSGVSSVTEFPRDSEVIEVFNCTAERTSKCKKIGSFSLINAICSRYRLSLLKPIVKALQISNKVSIRVDSRGFLSMQYLIDVGGETTFIEFFFHGATVPILQQ
ncbi:unnamed protein product [Soboliphyme baturini]|uniref:TAXi_C domain-containing protein n=1 Tax=Soboliphyme baturini TaxID=241478 RepID=A0A183IUL5_9BILA|nr:unnamed protein product [Soboliphyme baturini]